MLSWECLLAQGPLSLLPLVPPAGVTALKEKLCVGEAGRAVLWLSQNVAPVGQRPVGWLHFTLPWDQEEIRGEGAECRVYFWWPRWLRF